MKSSILCTLFTIAVCESKQHANKGTAAHTTQCLALLLYVLRQQLWSWRESQFTQPHFFLGKLEHAVNQYLVHILLLVTDNSSVMIQRKGGE